MRVFFDLDGTLTDISTRHHVVYQNCVKSFKGSPLDKDTYWTHKRNKTSWTTLLQLSGVDPQQEEAFLSDFILQIETPQMLEVDTLFPHSLDVLKSLSADYELILVSLRRNSDNLLSQLSGLGIESYFSTILSGHSETVSGTLDKKAEIIRANGLTGEGVMIGDTEADITCSKQLGFVSVAVTSGIRAENYLKSLDPDYTIDDISGLLEIIESKRV